MPLEIATLIPLGSWLGPKIADKGFDHISNKLLKTDDINKKFYAAVDKVSTNI